MKKIIILSILLLVTMGGVRAHADTATQNSFYYVFHLYYDAGKLVVDRDLKFPYDIIPGAYVADPVTTQFPYRGGVVNMTGQVSNTFTFDPQGGNPKLTAGKISVKAPYVADAQKVVFYDSQNNPLLTISVSASSFCNDDGICNSDKGEDYLSCSADCKQTLPAPPSVSPVATATAGSSGIVLGIVYAVIGLILVLLVIWFLRRRKGPTSLTPPGPSLPTPPTPSTPTNPV